MLIIVFIILIPIAGCTNKVHIDNKSQIKETVTETTTDSDKNDSNYSQVNESTNVDDTSIKIDFLYSFDYWNTYDYTKGLYPTKEDYEEAVLDYINRISTYLGKEKWLDQYDSNYKTLYVNLTISSNVRSGQLLAPVQYSVDSLVCELKINSRYFNSEAKHNPICHELTHLITYNPDLQSYSLSKGLNEGLCEYVSNAIGDKKDGINNGIDYHTYTLRYIENALETSEKDDSVLDDILANIGVESNSYLYPVFSEEWLFSFFYNVSFVKYIADTHGITYFILLHDPIEDSSVKAEHQTKLLELKSEWLDFINKYDCTMTVEEIKEYMMGNGN
jgi:hypothetical protein